MNTQTLANVAAVAVFALIAILAAYLVGQVAELVVAVFQNATVLMMAAA